MEEILNKVKLKYIKLNDPFFDSLKKDYQKIAFEKWFLKKANEESEAYVNFDKNKNIIVFLMLQIKEEREDDINPIQNKQKRIKISTLKIDDKIKNQRISEILIDIIFSKMNQENINEAYITLFKEKQKELYDLLINWGFKETGKKGNEVVLTKFRYISLNDVKKDYMWYFDQENFKNYKNSDWYVISLESQYHDKLLPKNELKNVKSTAKEFNISSISITKTYITGFRYIKLPKIGDFILEYRKSNKDPKIYKSAITGIGIIIDIKDGRNLDFNKWKSFIGNTSVFNDEELKYQYYEKKRKIVIKFLHIFSFGEGKNINYQTLQNNNLLQELKYPFAYPLRNKEIIINIIRKKLGLFSFNENFNVNSSTTSWKYKK